MVEELKAKLLAQNGARIRRIILYGSRARGPARPDSDFDLLVIEADPVSKRDEMWCLRHAVSDLPYPVDVWVMGEQEFEETKNVVGGLAYPAHKYGVVLYENVGFHAQQATEKFIKAFLVRHQLEFPKTHNIALLRQLVAQTDRDLADRLTPADALTPYGVEFRYPGDLPPLSRDQGAQALRLAE